MVELVRVIHHNDLQGRGAGARLSLGTGRAVVRQPCARRKAAGEDRSSSFFGSTLASCLIIEAAERCARRSRVRRHPRASQRPINTGSCRGPQSAAAALIYIYTSIYIRSAAGGPGLDPGDQGAALVGRPGSCSSLVGRQLLAGRLGWLPARHRDCRRGTPRRDPPRHSLSISPAGRGLRLAAGLPGRIRGWIRKGGGAGRVMGK
jgi:hypothetical protein